MNIYLLNVYVVVVDLNTILIVDAEQLKWRAKGTRDLQTRSPD